ncbi:hypothetical protein [Sphingomonas morindae]|uniref:Uncharacterized protein n=1 Tax=Sphingomonas morindae TaxID=1541170 RepID=A0ABY4X6A4_9SPHN|nr:hypothetical protein [Sphingomonas morindae]USI72392.1 hypothetical protein LHA26_13990 [Sphingomonas morindae]
MMPRARTALALLLAMAACHRPPPAPPQGGRAAEELRALIHVRRGGGAPAATAAAGGTGAASAVAARGPGASARGDCLGRTANALGYDAAWAGKLPPEWPLPPGAAISEAAGHDGACALRLVSFTVPGDRAALLAWYKARAAAAGYSAGRDDRAGDWVLAGDRGGRAFAVILAPEQGGRAPADFVWTAGG